MRIGHQSDIAFNIGKHDSMSAHFFSSEDTDDPSPKTYAEISGKISDVSSFVSPMMFPFLSHQINLEDHKLAFSRAANCSGVASA